MVRFSIRDPISILQHVGQMIYFQWWFFSYNRNDVLLMKIKLSTQRQHIYSCYKLKFDYRWCSYVFGNGNKATSAKAWFNSLHHLCNPKANLKGWSYQWFNVAFHISSYQKSPSIRFWPFCISSIFKFCNHFFVVKLEVYFFIWATCYQMFVP